MEAKQLVTDSIIPFLQYLHKFIEVTNEEFENDIYPFIQIRKFPKRAIITKRGDIENYFNFILKGLVRKYYKKDKEEINIQISTEGHIIHAQESFHSRLPSEYYVEAIEPVTLVSVAYKDLELLYSQNPKMERLGRLVITFSMVLKDKWQMQMIKLTPRERFMLFMERNPELLQRVPQKYLASYLNIQPETFSRFKHLIKNR